jgi:hypothetical protein
MIVDEAEDDEENDDEDDEEDDDSDNVDNDDKDQILTQLTLGEPGSHDFVQYETWHDESEPNKITKQKLAAMALDDFLGTDYSEGDNFDFETGITNSGYAWEILQAVEGKVDRYLGGLLWNLQTYQDGVCADYNFNYGRRMSPSAMDIVEFLQTAKAENRTLGKRELLGNDTFQPAVSAGLSCLAALPSEVKHLIPEPYRWLPDVTVESFYEQCMDPIDNCFDLKRFERLCEDEIAEIQKQREANGTLPVQQDDDDADQEHTHHGRRILIGDHSWTVVGRTSEPLTHAFDPPPPPSDLFSKLYPNDWIRVSRMIAMDAPRPRSVWGDRPSSSSHKPRHYKQKSEEITHSDLGNLLQGKKSILDIDYKIGYKNERDMMMRKKKPKTPKFSLKVEVKVNGNDPEVKVNGNDPVVVVNMSSRMKKFNITMPLKNPPVNLDGLTAMECLSQLSDIGLIGAVKCALTTPSKSDYASINPTNYEHLKLTVQRGKPASPLLGKDLTYDQDRDKNSQSRQALKQHLASLALRDITGPENIWSEVTIADIRKKLEGKAVDFKVKVSSVKATPAGKKAKRKAKAGDKVKEEPNGLNLDGQTAMTCLKQLADAGLIGEVIFSAEKESNLLERLHLTVNQGANDLVVSKDLEFSMDREVNSQSKQVRKQQLASFALGDMTGPTREWSNMTFADLRSFLLKKKESV